MTENELAEVAGCIKTDRPSGADVVPAELVMWVIKARPIEIVRVLRELYRQELFPTA